jgi:hypothetical protein
MAIALTEELLAKLLAGYKEFYLHKKLPLREAYKLTIVHYFSVGYEVRNNVLHLIIPSFQFLPTYGQFAYRGSRYYEYTCLGRKPRLSNRPLGRTPNYLKPGFGGDLSDHDLPLLTITISDGISTKDEPLKTSQNCKVTYQMQKLQRKGITVNGIH